jgi:hypothetical protein
VRHNCASTVRTDLGRQDIGNALFIHSQCGARQAVGADDGHFSNHHSAHCFQVARAGTGFVRSREVSTMSKEPSKPVNVNIVTSTCF